MRPRRAEDANSSAHPTRCCSRYLAGRGSPTAFGLVGLYSGGTLSGDWHFVVRKVTPYGDLPRQILNPDTQQYETRGPVYRCGDTECLEIVYVIPYNWDLGDTWASVNAHRGDGDSVLVARKDPQVLLEGLDVADEGTHLAMLELQGVLRRIGRLEAPYLSRRWEVSVIPRATERRRCARNETVGRGARNHDHALEAMAPVPWRPTPAHGGKTTG